MKRMLFLKYGLACYLLFFVVYAWLACFVGNFWLADTIDAPATTSTTKAVAINLSLILLFAAQHSVMARPAFKRVWTRWVPSVIERSTYVLVSCVVTALLIWAWQPLPAVVWNFTSPAARAVMWTFFAAGWLMVPLVSLMIHHFDLFGVRQVWCYFRGRPYTHMPFRTPALYRYVRHPLYIGWALAFWATPTMTVGHLLFAGSLTLYMVLAARVEERDLVAVFGRQYEEYRRRVPMFLPGRPRVTAEPQGVPSGQSASV